MPFNYAPLFSTLHKKGFKISDLRKAKIVSSATVAKIGKDEPVSMEVIDKICTVLGCNITDVLEHQVDPELQVKLNDLFKQEGIDGGESDL